MTGGVAGRRGQGQLSVGRARKEHGNGCKGLMAEHPDAEPATTTSLDRAFLRPQIQPTSKDLTGPSRFAGPPCPTLSPDVRHCMRSCFPRSMTRLLFDSMALIAGCDAGLADGVRGPVGLAMRNFGVQPWAWLFTSAGIRASLHDHAWGALAGPRDGVMSILSW